MSTEVETEVEQKDGEWIAVDTPSSRAIAFYQRYCGVDDLTRATYEMGDPMALPYAVINYRTSPPGWFFNHARIAREIEEGRL